MRRNLLNRTMFVMVCVVGLVTTSQSLVIEHPSLQNLSTITTDFSVSEDDVPSLKDVDERHLPKMNEEKLTRETTDRGIQESLFTSFRTDSRVGITKVFHRMQRDTYQVNNYETKVRSVVSEIKNGNIAEAKQLFVELDDNTLLERIVKDAYASNITHVNKIIWFVRKLPYIEQGSIAYTHLFEEMKKNRHLETPQLIVLDYYVKEFIEMPNFKSQTEDITNKFILLKGELIEPVQNITRIVLTGSTERVKAFAKQNIAFNDILYLQQIVHLLYANGNDNTEKVLPFVREFNTIPQIAIGYGAVIKEIHKHEYWNKDGGTLFTFGLLIKEAMEMPNYTNIDQEYKHIFETLKSNLPATVRQILWNDKFCIKNKQYNEYLYVGSNFHGNRLYSWGGGEKAGERGEWKFQSLNTSNIFVIY